MQNQLIFILLCSQFTVATVLVKGSERNHFKDSENMYMQGKHPIMQYY